MTTTTTITTSPKPTSHKATFSLNDCLKVAHISVCATVAASILICTLPSKNPSENTPLSKAFSKISDFISENPKACAKTAIVAGLLWDGFELAEKAWENKFQTCCLGIGITALVLL